MRFCALTLALSLCKSICDFIQMGEQLQNCTMSVSNVFSIDGRDATWARAHGAPLLVASAEIEMENAFRVDNFLEIISKSKVASAV